MLFRTIILEIGLDDSRLIEISCFYATTMYPQLNLQHKLIKGWFKKEFWKFKRNASQKDEDDYPFRWLFTNLLKNNQNHNKEADTIATRWPLTEETKNLFEVLAAYSIIFPSTWLTEATQKFVSKKDFKMFLILKVNWNFTIQGNRSFPNFFMSHRLEVN